MGPLPPRYRSPRPHPRRGVTLIEMLVTLALLILMMTIIVSIFSAATGAVTGAKAFQGLDSSLRQLDTTIRQDLIGVTANMTPPLNPTDNLGYFEYGENEFADLQGEDSDDYLRFTVKSPEGQPFIGRIWLGTPIGYPLSITSQYAEVIYFLRNGNLYRRVLLVAPQLQDVVNSTIALTGTTYTPQLFSGLQASWQSMNDLSAHPAPAGPATGSLVILNTLGHLTNRENRYASPRFCNDYVQHGVPGTIAPDGLPDDENQDASSPVNYLGDGIPDFYPTLYPAVFSNASKLYALIYENYGNGYASRIAATYTTMPFPFIYPGMYSKPDLYSAANGLGWIHSTNPASSAAPTLATQQLINHSPLEIGDSLPLPTASETWFGFPTWRETLSPNWADPVTKLNLAGAQPTGLSPIDPSVGAPAGFPWLPPMIFPYRIAAQANNDGIGSLIFSGDPTAASTTPAGQNWTLWANTWEDDLVLTGVRSFDVKAYDDVYSGYADLGWGDDLRLYSVYGTPPTNPPLLNPPNPPVITPITPFTWPPVAGTTYDLIKQTFAHEGRMPPRVGDNRFNPQYPAENVGDDTTSVIRLRRVWDSWSTAYSDAPDSSYDPAQNVPQGMPYGYPIYPSYDPPYKPALRGIQIQIRVTDPRSEHLKILTIRHDFSDKL